MASTRKEVKTTLFAVSGDLLFTIFYFSYYIHCTAQTRIDKVLHTEESGITDLKRSLLSLLIIGFVSLTGVKLSQAFFSDTETSNTNTISTGQIDLKVNGEDNPTAVVNFSNLLPGGQQAFPKTLRVTDSDAHVWMHIKDVQTAQGTQSEAETTEEAQLGYEKHDIDKYLSYRASVGGIPIISSPISFSDAVSCWIPLGVLTAGQIFDMEQVFGLDSTVTNWAQGDTMNFTEEFYAEQADFNPSPTGPVSTTGRIWDAQNEKCIDSLELVTSVNIPANLTTGVSSITSEQGQNYKIKAVGTANAGDTIIFDAKYSLTERILNDTWTDVVSGYESAGPNLLNLMVNNVFVDWGQYNDEHTYWHEFTGDGNVLNFKVYDTYSSNNTGHITVEIYKIH